MEDLSVGVYITDPKGDRSKRPGEQPDPDAYVRIIEERKDSIVVRGYKSFISGASAERRPSQNNILDF